MMAIVIIIQVVVMFVMAVVRLVIVIVVVVEAVIVIVEVVIVTEAGHGSRRHPSGGCIMDAGDRWSWLWMWSSRWWSCYQHR